MAAAATATMAMAPMAAHAQVQMDERFAWTSELIDAVLALRFKDAVIGRGIDSAKGNEAKRNAWTALATQLQITHGVNVHETKIRRAISKWQSQHRSWMQTIANKSPEELTQADRPPTYMPVLLRYFQEGNGSPSTEKLANAAVARQVGSRPASEQLALVGFEAALYAIPSPCAVAVVAPSPSVMPANIPASVPTPPTTRPVLEVVPVMARSESERAPLQQAQAPAPTTSFHVMQTVSATPTCLPTPIPTVIPHDSEEEPTTSQEDFPATLQEMPATKRQKISPEKKAAVPSSPTRVAPTATSTPAKTSIPVSQAASVVGSTELKALASRVTQQLASVQQEQLLLQKKHFEEQLELQRKQYEEQFAIQRKQVEVVQAVLGSLQGSIAI